MVSWGRGGGGLVTSYLFPKTRLSNKFFKAQVSCEIVVWSFWVGIQNQDTTHFLQDKK